MIRSPALSVNQLAETNRHPADESREQILQYPFEAPMPPHLKHFKKLLQRTPSPHTMNKILRELDAGQLDRRSLDDSNGSPSEFSQEESLLPNSSVTRNNLYYTYSRLLFLTLKTLAIPLCSIVCHKNPPPVSSYVLITKVSTYFQ